MHQHYKDILDRISEKPLWFDERGVPRYSPFAPQKLNSIYVKEAALAEIACQNCSARFRVALSEQFCARQFSLSDEIRQRIVHYGDPPNIECCDVGAMENSIMHEIIEYWARGRETSRWTRYVEFEGPVPEERLRAIDAVSKVASSIADGARVIRVACTSERNRQDILGRMTVMQAREGRVLIAEPDEIGVIVSNTLNHYAADQDIAIQKGEPLQIRPQIIECSPNQATYLDLEDIDFAIFLSPSPRVYRKAAESWRHHIELLLNDSNKKKIELSLAHTPVVFDGPDVIVDAGLLEARTA